MPKANLSELGKRWSSPYVARQQVHTFSGGILTDKYLANLDSQGLGPPGRIKIGRKVAYPVNSLILWLESRSTVEDAE